MGLVLILYLTQQAYEFSRLVYLIFAIINTVITFIAHIVYRRYMLDYYRKSVNSTKMFVLTQRDNSEGCIGDFAAGESLGL